MRRSTPSSVVQLDPTYPNPFNSGTVIEFSLPRAGHTEVVIFNILGEEIARPLSENLPAGSHTIHWDGTTTNGSPAPSGEAGDGLRRGRIPVAGEAQILRLDPVPPQACPSVEPGQDASHDRFAAEVREAGEGAWEDLKSGVQGAWDAMEDALKSARSKFK